MLTSLVKTNNFTYIFISPRNTIIWYSLLVWNEDICGMVIFQQWPPYYDDQLECMSIMLTNLSACLCKNCMNLEETKYANGHMTVFRPVSATFNSRQKSYLRCTRKMVRITTLYNNVKYGFLSADFSAVDSGHIQLVWVWQWKQDLVPLCLNLSVKIVQINFTFKCFLWWYIDLWLVQSAPLHYKKLSLKWYDMIKVHH